MMFLGGAFLGKPFGGLDSDIPPQYVEDFDVVFLVWALQGIFPRTTGFLKKLPSKSILHFFETDVRLYKVSTLLTQRLSKKISVANNRTNSTAQTLSPNISNATAE